MDGSILLTKKAALIGGGAAATTTAVTVPIVVTQTKGSENDTTSSDDPRVDPNKDQLYAPTKQKGPKNLQDPSIKWDLNLSMTDKSLFTSFNKPGDCIKKSFPGIENEITSTQDNEKGFFHKPDSVSKKTAPHAFATVDLNNASHSVSSPDFACLMSNEYKDETNKEFRAELVLKKGSWGYAWMSGWKKTDKGHEFFIREAVFKNENSTWSAYSGIDARYLDLGQESIAPKFDADHFPGLETREVWECADGDQKEDCYQKKANVAVWAKKESDGKAFLPSNATGLSNAILPLAGKREYDNPGKAERQSVFGDKKWFPASKQDRPMITFNKDQVFPDGYKGEWKDIVSFCETTSTGEPYTLFCQSTSS